MKNNHILTKLISKEGNVDIIDKLIQAIPIVDEGSKKILSELLVSKLTEQANVEPKKVELTDEERDELEVLNYSGEKHG